MRKAHSQRPRTRIGSLSSQWRTLFLDEVAEIDRARSEIAARHERGRAFERSAASNLRADVRLIAATNKNLEQLVARWKIP